MKLYIYNTDNEQFLRKVPTVSNRWTRELVHARYFTRYDAADRTQEQLVNDNTIILGEEDARRVYADDEGEPV